MPADGLRRDRNDTVPPVESLMYSLPAPDANLPPSALSSMFSSSLWVMVSNTSS